MKKPIVTQSRSRAYAYILPREARAAIAMLRRHNITVEVLNKATKLEVEAYELADVEYLREYNHAAAVKVKVGKVIKVTKQFPAGTFIVHTAQVQGRVVAHMLEPETNDNVVRWNTMDAFLPKTRTPQAIAAAKTKSAGSAQSTAKTKAAAGDNQKPPVTKAAGAADTAGGRSASRQRWGSGAGARRGNRGIGRRRSQGPAVIPIYKLRKPTPLPSRLLGRELR